MRMVLKDLIPADKPIILHKSKSFEGKEKCSVCGGAGYMGRLGIFEVFPVTPAISKLILTRSPMHEIENVAIAEGMITMKQDGYMKALDGITTIEEVLRVAQD
jgi:type II secretory ATPase GspE/PulE/Tfp pilus assembly ATPase PilB-like protein